MKFHFRRKFQRIIYNLIDLSTSLHGLPRGSQVEGSFATDVAIVLMNFLLFVRRFEIKLIQTQYSSDIRQRLNNYRQYGLSVDNPPVWPFKRQTGTIHR